MRKRLCALMMTLILPLTACGGSKGENEAEETLARVRNRYLELTTCSGHGELTADYGQRVYTYGIDFSWQKEGETLLVLTAPENVAGASAHIAAGETALEFDGVMLETGPLNGEGLAPIDAIPALLSYAREGFVAECVMEEAEGTKLFHMICRDPEAQPGEGTEAELWFQAETLELLRGEISSQGETVIQCGISGFSMEFSQTG